MTPHVEAAHSRAVSRCLRRTGGATSHRPVGQSVSSLLRMRAGTSCRSACALLQDARGCDLPDHHRGPARRAAGSGSWRIVAAYLDEVLAAAVKRATARPAVTGELTVRYEKPVPVETPIVGKGRAGHRSRALRRRRGAAGRPAPLAPCWRRHEHGSFPFRSDVGFHRWVSSFISMGAAFAAALVIATASSAQAQTRKPTAQETKLIRDCVEQNGGMPKERQCIGLVRRAA